MLCFAAVKGLFLTRGCPPPWTVTDDLSGRRTGWANWWLSCGDKADLQWQSRGRLELTTETAWASKSRVSGSWSPSNAMLLSGWTAPCMHLPGWAAEVDSGLWRNVPPQKPSQTAAKTHSHTSAQTHRQSSNTPSLKHVLPSNHLLPLQCPGSKYLLSLKITYYSFLENSTGESAKAARQLLGTDPRDLNSVVPSSTK